jgi:hypothetical protein
MTPVDAGDTEVAFGPEPDEFRIRLHEMGGGVEQLLMEALVSHHFSARSWKSVVTPGYYAESENLYRGIVDRRDYPLLLKHYNRKSLASRISRNLGLGEGEYPKFVLRVLQTAEGEPLRSALRSRLPVIPPLGESS